MRERRNTHMVLMWKPDGNKPLGRSIYGWENILNKTPVT